MFHLFNRVYFELSSSAEEFSKQLERLNLKNESDYWSYIYSSQRPEVRKVYSLKGKDLLRLQISFWKSILPHATIESIYKLHLIYIEDCKFRTHLSVPLEASNLKSAYLSLENFSRQEFGKVYEAAEKIEFLQNIPKESLSFEFQLSDFFYNEKSNLKQAVLDKVKHCTWANWLAELEILKTDIINGISDINRLLPKENAINDTDPTQFYSQAIGHPYLCWIADADFGGSNYHYVEKTYDKNIFKFLYECFYNMWQVNGEDMSELIDLIYSHQYETLLFRDVKRSFGSVYAAGRFRNRMNQVLISMIYKHKRNNELGALKPYTLS